VHARRLDESRGTPLEFANGLTNPNHDLYLYDFQREVISRVSHDGISHGPIWTPDGKRIAYRTWKARMMTLAWMPADRSGPEERLVNYTAWQSAASSDGEHLAFDQHDRGTGYASIWVLPVSGDRQPRLFANSGAAASRLRRTLRQCTHWNVHHRCPRLMPSHLHLCTGVFQNRNSLLTVSSDGG
jgi:Tol biopolymer transport system component